MCPCSASCRWGGDGVQHVRLSVIATNAAGLASTLGRELTIDTRPVLADVAKVPPPRSDLGATCGAADAAVAIADAPLEVAAPPFADNVHHWTLCSRAGCGGALRRRRPHRRAAQCVARQRERRRDNQVSAVATAYTGAVSAAANLSVVVDGTPPELTSAVEPTRRRRWRLVGSLRPRVGRLVAAADDESGVASYAASLVDGATDSVLLRRAAAGCAATNMTLSRQLHHGARYHVSLEAANGVGLRVAVNSSVFTVDLSTGLRPSRSAIADAAGDAVDSVSNLSAVPVVWTAQLTPADAAAVSSPQYNASGNATRAPAYPPLAPTSHFSFAVLIHEKTNLTADEVQELCPTLATCRRATGRRSSQTRARCPTRPRARRRPRTAGKVVELPIAVCAATGGAPADGPCALLEASNVSGAFEAALDVRAAGLVSGDVFEMIVFAHSAAIGRRPAERRSQPVLVDLTPPTAGVVHDARYGCNYTANASCGDSREQDVDVVGATEFAYACGLSLTTSTRTSLRIRRASARCPSRARPGADDGAARPHAARLRSWRLRPA